MICVAIPTIILFALLQIDYSSFTRYHFTQVSTTQLENEMNSVKSWIKDKEFSIEQFGAATEAFMNQYGFNENMTVLLTSLVESSEELQHIYVTTESGSHYISGNVPPLLDGRMRPWYIGAVKQDVYVSAPYEDILTKELVITISKSLRDSKGRLQGVIGMDLLVSDLISMIEQNTSSTENQVIIQSEDGSVIYLSDTQNNLNIDELIFTEDGIQEFKLQDKRYAGMRFEMPEMHSSIYVIVDTSKYYNGRNQFNMDYLFNMTVIIACLLILIRVFSSHLYKPLMELNAQVKKMMLDEASTENKVLPKDLEVILSKFYALQKVSSDRQLEVAQMNMHVHEKNDDIHSMNQELKKSFESLKTLNDDLEYQEKKYFDLVNNIPDIIWITEPSGRLIYGNEKFENLVGLEIELHGRDFITDHIEGLSRKGQKLQLFHERDYSYIELTLNCDDGSQKSMSGSVSRIFEDDTMIAIQGIFRDVSESRAMYVDYYNRNRELTLVNDITKALILNNDLEGILKDIANKVGHVMNVSMCTIRILDEDNHFGLRAAAGSMEKVIYDNAPHLDKSHMGIAYKENNIIIIDQAFTPIIDEPELIGAMETLNHVIYIPLATNDNVYGIISIGTESKITNDNIKILESLADQAALAIERMLIFEKLKHHYFKTIEALVAANDAKVPKMEGHTKRVSDIAVEVGKRMYLRKKDIDDIYIAGLLHDIGKMNIEDALLSKESELTREEQNIMDCHPMFAKKILEPIGMSDSITEGIYYHHKKYDLSGEPKNANITTLPLIARIIGVVDDLDARLVGLNIDDPQTLPNAIEEIKKGSGIEYCPEVVRVIEEIAADAPEIIRTQYGIRNLESEVSV